MGNFFPYIFNPITWKGKDLDTIITITTCQTAQRGKRNKHFHDWAILYIYTGRQTDPPDFSGIISVLHQEKQDEIL